MESREAQTSLSTRYFLQLILGDPEPRPIERHILSSESWADLWALSQLGTRPKEGGTLERKLFLQPPVI